MTITEAPVFIEPSTVLPVDAELAAWMQSTHERYLDASRPIESADDARVAGLTPNERTAVMQFDDAALRGEIYWSKITGSKLEHPPLPVQPSWASERRLILEPFDDAVVQVQFWRDAKLGAASVVLDQFVNLHLKDRTVEMRRASIILYVTDSHGHTSDVEIDEDALPLVLQGLGLVRNALAVSPLTASAGEETSSNVAPIDTGAIDQPELDAYYLREEADPHFAPAKGAAERDLFDRLSGRLREYINESNAGHYAAIEGQPSAALASLADAARALVNLTHHRKMAEGPQAQGDAAMSAHILLLELAEHALKLVPDEWTSEPQDSASADG